MGNLMCNVILYLVKYARVLLIHYISFDFQNFLYYSFPSFMAVAYDCIFLMCHPVVITEGLDYVVYFRLWTTIGQFMLILLEWMLL